MRYVKKMEKKSFELLKYVKFSCAILIALLYHYRNDFVKSFGYKEDCLTGLLFLDFWAEYGWFLVDVFFIISGLLFVFSYENKIIQETLSFKSFLIRRIKKLYPLMIISAFCMLILEWIYYIHTQSWWLCAGSLYQFFLTILGLNFGYFNFDLGFLNAPSWYICILVQCYIVAYFLVKHKKSSLLSYFYAFVICNFLYSTLSYQLQWISYISRGLADFFIGCILMKLLQHHFFESKKNKINYICLFFLLAGYVIYKKYPIFIGDLYQALRLFYFPIFVFLTCNLEVKRIKYLEKCIGWGGYIMYLFNLPLQLFLLEAIKFLKLEIQFNSLNFFLFQFFFQLVFSIVFALLYSYLSRKFIIRYKKEVVNVKEVN